ncbi:MAG: type II secretion system protein [Kiritimatiellae bacterium]|nr:type II secretion system protein [Kiritimatiellia bacterium]
MSVAVNNGSSMRPAPSSPHASTPGFTLIELLVVLAIIGLLASTVSLVTLRGIAQGQTAACQLNLRDWSTAFYAYAADHQGHFPHTDDFTRDDKSGWVPNPHEHCYLDELPPYMGLPAWRDYPDGRKPTGSPWQCPAAKFAEPSAYGYDTAHLGIRSYAMNSYLSYDFAYGGLGTHGGPYLNTLRCVAPARTILMFDQCANPTDTATPGRKREAGYHSAQDATYISVRHRKLLGGHGANFLFLDGHVDWRDDVWIRTHSDVPKPGDWEWLPYDYSH